MGRRKCKKKWWYFPNYIITQFPRLYFKVIPKPGFHFYEDEESFKIISINFNPEVEIWHIRYIVKKESPDVQRRFCLSET